MHSFGREGMYLNVNIYIERERASASFLESFWLNYNINICLGQSCSYLEFLLV